MTSLLIDDPSFPFQASDGSFLLKTVNSETNFQRILQKSRNLRPDSPTTIQACQELGIQLGDLKQKNLDDFKDSTVEEEIVHFRFQHYKKRYAQLLIDVLARKKQIVKKLKDKKLRELEQLQSADNSNTLNLSASSPPFQFKSAENSPDTVKTPFYFPKNLIKSVSSATFNKSMSFFRKSKDVNSNSVCPFPVINNDSTLQNAEKTIDGLNKTLSDEIFKYNRAKLQKQKEAKRRYEEEINKLKALESRNDKERRKKQLEKKQIEERKKVELDKKKLQEERFEKIKEAGKNFHMQKKGRKRRHGQSACKSVLFLYYLLQKLLGKRSLKKKE